MTNERTSLRASCFILTPHVHHFDANERRYDQLVAQEDLTKSTSAADRVLWMLSDNLGSVRHRPQRRGRQPHELRRLRQPHRRHGPVADSSLRACATPPTRLDFDLSLGTENHNRISASETMMDRSVRPARVGSSVRRGRNRGIVPFEPLEDRRLLVATVYVNDDWVLSADNDSSGTLTAGEM